MEIYPPPLLKSCVQAINIECEKVNLQNRFKAQSKGINEPSGLPPPVTTETFRPQSKYNSADKNTVRT